MWKCTHVTCKSSNSIFLISFSTSMRIAFILLMSSYICSLECNGYTQTQGIKNGHRWSQTMNRSTPHVVLYSNLSFYLAAVWNTDTNGSKWDNHWLQPLPPLMIFITQTNNDLIWGHILIYFLAKTHYSILHINEYRTHIMY
jgi:hypothetical protein